MNDKEIKALIRLLDDPDQSVYENVSQRLLHEGEVIIPILEASYGLTQNEMLNLRLEAILEELKNQGFLTAFKTWANQENPPLIHGLNYINSLFYPDTDFERFKVLFDELRKQIWLELNDKLTGFEAITVINRLLYDIRGYGVETKQQENTAVHFVETIFHEKIASPFPFIAAYTLVAQSLNLPVLPVYLPGLLILAYENEEVAKEVYGKNANNVLFYINPYDKGAFLGRKALDFVVQKKRIPVKEHHFEPLSNLGFVWYYLKYLKETHVVIETQPSYSKLLGMMEILKEKNLEA
jgi:hypothetical protein